MLTCTLWISNGKIQKNYRVIKKCFLGGNVPWVQLLTDGTTFRIWNRRLPPGGQFKMSNPWRIKFYNIVENKMSAFWFLIRFFSVFECFQSKNLVSVPSVTQTPKLG